MDTEDVSALIGDAVGTPDLWKNHSPEELATIFTMEVVGGSSQKPTGATKKREALEIGQVLGQFANAAPQVVELLMRIFQQAFDEVVMRDEDWAALRESIFAQQQRGISTGGPGPNQPQGQAQSQPGQQPNGQGSQLQEQVAQMIAQLGPEQKQQLESLVQQGVPPSQALAQVQGQTGVQQ
jgi:hypothetical protein